MGKAIGIGAIYDRDALEKAHESRNGFLRTLFGNPMARVLKDDQGRSTFARGLSQALRESGP